MFKKILSLVTALLVIIFPLVFNTSELSAEVHGLPEHIVVGYWENWVTDSKLTLRQTDPGWDVIIVSFMLTDSTNSHCYFSPDYSLYPGGDEAFIEDIKFCQSRGQKVLISYGGAIGYSLTLDTEAQRDDFYTSCRDIIAYYGFDGFDIDIEQCIISNDGETSMLSPTKPMNVNLIYICRALADYFGEDFILTMAPEHPYVQGGAYWWGGWKGIWGAYLPLLQGVRDILTFVHPQLYNNPFTDYPAGYQQYDVETYIFATELLIEGFDTPIGERFDGLRPDQVVLGVLTVNGSSSDNGELTADEYGEILRALLEDYPDFRGAMTWSINGDKKSGGKFLTVMRGIIDSLSQDEIRGDINFDGALDEKDVSFLKSYLLGKKLFSADEQGNAADLNDDGIVNAFDLALMKNSVLIKNK